VSFSRSRSRSRVILLVEQDDDDSNNDDDGDYEDYNHEFIPANSQPTIISFTHGNVSHSNTQETTKKTKERTTGSIITQNRKERSRQSPKEKKKYICSPSVLDIKTPSIVKVLNMLVP
jgi:hypothetical protein